MSSTPPNSLDGNRGFDDILANLIFSVPIGLLLLITYLLFCTRKFNYVHNSNLYKSPLIKRESLSSRFIYAFKLSDMKLLAHVGLDCYVTLKILKLLIIITFSISLFSLCLCILYWISHTYSPDFSYDKFTSTGHYLYFCLTIRVLPKHLLWIPLIFSYIITCLTFYFIYSFYKSFITLRQAFFKDPSSFYGFPRLCRIVELFGGNLNLARNYINSQFKAAIISGISADYGSEDLLRFFSSRSFDIVHLQFIHSSEKMKSALRKRQHYLEELKKAYEYLHTNLLDDILKKFTGHFDSKEAQIEFTKFKMTLEKFPSNPDLISKAVNTINSSASFLGKFRKIHKKRDTEVDAITYYLDAFHKKDIGYRQSVKSFTSDLDDDILIPRVDETEQNTDTESLQMSKVPHDLSLISRDIILNYDGVVQDCKLSLWGSSRSAIIFFSNYTDAFTVSQLLLSKRPLSMSICMAPAADDLIWKNAYLPAADKRLRLLAGSIFYVILNIFFLIIAFFLGVLLELDTLLKIFPSLNSTLLANDYFKSILRGILTPLAQTLSFLIVPYILNSISKYRGLVSKTSALGWAVSKYCWFLLIQQSILGFYPGSNVIELINKWLTGNLKTSISELQSNIPSKSVFFLNLIIQKALVSAMLMLAKPIPYVSEFLFKNGIKNSSLREASMLREPPFLNIFPENIVFAYLMCMAFAIVTPIFAFFSLLFFVIFYFVIATNFIFSEAVIHESGGLAWQWISGLLLAGLPLGQLFLAFQLFATDRVFEGIMMFPLFFGTLYFIDAFKRWFDPKIHNIPLIAEDFSDINNTLQQIKEVQDNIFFQQEYFNSNHQFITIGTPNLNDDNKFIHVPIENAEIPYKEPFLLKCIKTLGLPYGFAEILDLYERNNSNPPIQEILFLHRKNKISQ